VNIPTLGQTLTGNTSGATGVIIALGGSYIILTKVVGAFTSSEVVKVGATTIGTATPVTVVHSNLVSAQYTQLAADTYRADIGAVPGSGAVRGVVAAIFAGVDIVYAFRNNAGGTAVDLYKSTTGGWTQVPFYNEVSFTAGGAAVPADGVTLTQGGVTATVKRVVHQSGSWAGSTAAGRFIITNPAGGNFAAGAATAGAVAVTLSGIQTAITMSVGGKFEFYVDNFTGSSSTLRIYGCDGVNRGFEFDGDVLVPITTGFSPDAPAHVCVHHLHLVFSFTSSIGISAIGFPYKWSAVDGAVEVGCGNIVTNLLKQPGSATSETLAITTRSDIKILYGASAASWLAVSLNAGTGGIAFSAQQMTDGYVLTGFGVTGLRTAQEYGNFRQSSLTTAILPYITTQRSQVNYSVLNRTKNQYRVLFADGGLLALTIVNGKLAGIGKSIFPTAMNCAWSSLTTTQAERVFYGASTTGFVYQADTGSSFDGGIIDAFLVFNWNTMKMPRRRKRFRKLSVEMQSNFYAAFQFGYSLGYGRADLLQPTLTSYETAFSGVPLWDTAIWDAFTWDGVTVTPSEVRMIGTAENVQVTIRSTTNYIQPFTVNSMIFHYSLRRGVR
jgi:hypothetical protein